MLGDFTMEKVDLSVCHTGPVSRVVSPHMNRERKLNEEKRPPRRLAYIDGIRGICALLIYMQHYEMYCHTWAERGYMESGWGYGGQHHFASLPFIRIFFVGGHHGVTTFLVISGYVLSNSPLRCIHVRDTARLHDIVSSALLRRFLRLWIPVVITTFLYMLSWHLLDIKTVALVREKNLSAEFVRWYDFTRTTSFHYATIYLNSYNFYVWTIPLEFRGSITVYISLIALQNAPQSKRLLCEFGLIWYFTYVTDGWYCALFMSGMLLSDLDLLADHGNLPAIFQRFRQVRAWIFPLLMIVSVYLGGVPCFQKDLDYLRANPGWYWLSYTVPRAMDDPRWWFRGWAAILTVVAVPRIRVLRTFLESAICQYLGKISFAFYLVHGLVQFTLGDRVYAATGRVIAHHAELVPQWINWLPLSSWGPMGMEINFIAPHLILFPFTIWLADLTTRVVDQPTMSFCRWLERWILEDGMFFTREKTEQIV